MDEKFFKFLVEKYPYKLMPYVILYSEYILWRLKNGETYKEIFSTNKTMD